MSYQLLHVAIFAHSQQLHLLHQVFEFDDLILIADLCLSVLQKINAFHESSVVKREPESELDEEFVYDGDL